MLLRRVGLTLTLSVADWQVIRIGLTMLQILVMSSEQAGQALIPYYRQLLPVCSLFWGSGTRGASRGDFYYSQARSALPFNPAGVLREQGWNICRAMTYVHVNGP